MPSRKRPLTPPKITPVVVTSLQQPSITYRVKQLFAEGATEVETPINEKYWFRTILQIDGDIINIYPDPLLFCQSAEQQSLFDTVYQQHQKSIEQLFAKVLVSEYWVQRVSQILSLFTTTLPSIQLLKHYLPVPDELALYLQSLSSTLHLPEFVIATVITLLTLAAVALSSYALHHYLKGHVWQIAMRVFGFVRTLKLKSFKKVPR